MKRLTKTAIGSAVVIALAGTAIAAAIWVVDTTPGTRWLLSKVTSLSGGTFSVQKVDGKIIDHLSLTNVRINLAGQKVELDFLELRWKPLLQLAGTVVVEELTLEGVHIQDNTPRDNKPPVLTWPTVSRSVRLLDVAVEQLRVTNFSYRRLQEQPLLVAHIASSVTWHNSQLSMKDLTAVSTAGRINGSASIGFNRPALTTNLVVIPAKATADMDRFTLVVFGSTNPEQFTPAFTIAGSARGQKRLELSGTIGMAQNSILLRKLRLTKAGQKGVITADGSLVLTALESVLSLQIKAAGLDLSPELNVPTDLSGTLKFAGTLNSYRGDFALANRAAGWQAASVSAKYSGTQDGMKLTSLTSRVLDGSLSGNLDIDWRDGVAVQGALSGRNLNPAKFDPTWKGVANFSATGRLTRSVTGIISGNVRGDLQESSLHGQALTGRLQARFTGSNLSISRLALQGKGFDLNAAGELNRKLTVAAHINDFSRLVPGAAGTLRADGWVRWRDGRLSGAAAGVGNSLAYAGTSISSATIDARLDEGADYPLHVAASLSNVIYDAYMVDAMTVTAEGTLRNHTMNATFRSAGSTAQLALSAGYSADIWKGMINHLEGKDSSGAWKLSAPTAFSASKDKVSLASMTITAGAAESLEVAADLNLKPPGGRLRAAWTNIDLTRANPYLKDATISGSSSGKVRLDLRDGKLRTLAGNATGSGTFTSQDGIITINRSQVTIDGNERGLRMAFELGESAGGKAEGTFVSSAPLGPVIPESGKLTVDVSGIDLTQLKPWLPPDTTVEGHLNGRVSGTLLPGQRFKLNGTTAVSGGVLHQKRGVGELSFAIAEAQSSWQWQDEVLTGSAFLTMTDYGRARADFQLPVPARFPVKVNQKGVLKAAMTGTFQEKGIFSALFPESFRKSSGELDVSLVVGGIWEMPEIGGTVQLARGESYFPAAGITLKDIKLTAHLEKNLIVIDTFRAVSGPGHLEGTARLTLADWKVITYQGTIRGKNFQTVYFPELQIQSSPELSFEGTPQKLTLRGELLLPELHYIGAPARTAIGPSSDAVVEGKFAPLAAHSPLALDIKIRVVPGERVFVKVVGIDARLGGAMDLSLSGLDNITSNGAITVVKGVYRTYGVNLDIVRGRTFFVGNSIDNPSLDFLALRTVGDVRVGVTVTGTLRKPVTKLYSEPAMPDIDILAYIVLGHPLSNSGEQASLVSQAASALLTSGQAADLQDQIKATLGLSTLNIQGGASGTAGAMGYKPMQVTAPGTIPEMQQPGITETVLTVGKYVTPKLYISFGRSLFSGSSLFLLRYDIFKQWQIETQTGSESGADLFYKLEFK